MSTLGVREATTSVEVAYSRPSGPPIEIDIEISGVVYCDDSEWGLEASDITAKVVERVLTDDEIVLLDLETILCESALDSESVAPKIGDYYKCTSDGYVWCVKDVILGWRPDSNRRYVLLERPGDLACALRKIGRPSSTVRRLVELAEFDYATDSSGKRIFQWTSNQPVTPNELSPVGDV